MKSKCCNYQSDVIDSRTKEDGLVVRRRRVCTRCAERFTTYEFHRGDESRFGHRILKRIIRIASAAVFRIERLESEDDIED